MKSSNDGSNSRVLVAREDSIIGAFTEAEKRKCPERGFCKFHGRGQETGEAIYWDTTHMARNGKHGNILTCSGGRDDGVKVRYSLSTTMEGRWAKPVTRVRSTGH